MKERTSTRAKLANRSSLSRRPATDDAAILDEPGWAVGILDSMGTSIAELHDVTLREAVAAVKAWRRHDRGGFEIVPPARDDEAT